MERQKMLSTIQNDNVRFIMLQFSDIQGHVKSVTIPSKQFASSMEDGTWFDGSSIKGFARIFESDMYLKPDLSTYALLPWLESEAGNTARFICDVHNPDGTPYESDPRYILKKALTEASSLGYRYNTGPELEFFLFKKTENGHIDTEPNDQGGYFDLSMDEAYAVRRDMIIALEKFGMNIEASHHEVAVGQHEINFTYDDALKTADNAMTFKFVLKAIAAQHGLHATFMPKPIMTENGSGMHVHQSLSSLADGKNLFYDAEDEYNLSRIAYNFIAGQLTHAKALAAITSPTVNSYKRLVPGYEAPVYISWGRTNRSALIRVPLCPPGKEKAARAELRCPDPTSNIYLAFAAMLKAGLDGLKRNIMPQKPLEEDLYSFTKKETEEKNIQTLPGSLGEAITELKNNRVVLDALGGEVSKKYISLKTKEWDEYRLFVSKWEIERYLTQY